MKKLTIVGLLAALLCVTSMIAIRSANTAFCIHCSYYTRRLP